MTFEQHPPVNGRHHLLFHIPGKPGRLKTVDDPLRERWQVLATITEFGENNLASLDRQWTGTVAIVFCTRRTTFQQIDNIDGGNGRLFACGRRSLGVRRGTGIANAENVAKI